MKTIFHDEKPGYIDFRHNSDNWYEIFIDIYLDSNLTLGEFTVEIDEKDNREYFARFLKIFDDDECIILIEIKRKYVKPFTRQLTVMSVSEDVAEMFQTLFLISK